MATENPHQIVSKIAGTGCINKRFVTEVAGGIVNLTTANTQKAAGVVAMVSTGKTQTAITAGDECPVCISGIVLVESGALVADAAQVMSDATGRAITFAAGAAALSLGVVVGGAGAGAAGEDLSIRLYDIPQSIAV